MDDSRSSTGSPVPAQFPMRRVGADLSDIGEERTSIGQYPVVRPEAKHGPQVCSLLHYRLQSTTFTNMVMWRDREMSRQGMTGVVVSFTTPCGMFVPHLLELIEWIEVSDQRYRRLPEWDGQCGSDDDGRHDVYLVVAVPSGARQPPLMTRDVRFVFESER